MVHCSSRRASSPLHWPFTSSFTSPGSPAGTSWSLQVEHCGCHKKLLREANIRSQAAFRTAWISRNWTPLTCTPAAKAPEGICCNHRGYGLPRPCLCCLVFNFCNGVRYRTQCLLRKQGASFVNPSLTNSVLAQPKLTLDRCARSPSAGLRGRLVALPHETMTRCGAVCQWVARPADNGSLAQDESGAARASHVPSISWARSHPSVRNYTLPAALTEPARGRRRMPHAGAARGANGIRRPATTQDLKKRLRR